MYMSTDTKNMRGRCTVILFVYRGRLDIYTQYKRDAQYNNTYALVLKLTYPFGQN